MRRVNLLRAHGSPSRRQYKEGCRCAACCGQKAGCDRDRAARPEYAAVYRAAHREQFVGYYAARRDRKYHLLPGEWDAIFASQSNSCAVCGTTEPGGRGWQTDHDHGTGLTRGILCHHCNTGIGYFRDDPERLMAGIEYLAAATL